MDDGFQAWSPNPVPADNYDPDAEIDDGLCVYYGCMDDGNHVWSRIPGLAACNYMHTKCKPVFYGRFSKPVIS